MTQSHTIYSTLLSSEEDAVALAILHDRIQNDIQRLKNILKERLSMNLRYEYYLRHQKAPWGLQYFYIRPILNFTDTHRTFRGYRNYYELLTEMPRFKHSTISFRTMRDIISQIRKWFQSAECQ
jgi:hypothetical protein